MKIISRSSKDTAKIATDLTKKIKKNTTQKHAIVIAFEGELGAGKTTFIKAMAKTLGIKTHITSPTFVLMKTYRLRDWGQNTGVGHFIHIDAYRLKNYRDLLPLSIKEALSNPQNIIAIEWSERVKPILPKKFIKVHLDHINGTTRRILIS